MKYFLITLLLGIAILPTEAQIFQAAKAQLSADFKQDALIQVIHTSFPESFFLETDIELLHVRHTPGGQYWTFQQTFRGQAIYEATLTAKVNRDGKVPFFMNNLYTGNPVPAADKDVFSLTDIGIRVHLLKRMPAFSHHPEAVWLPEGSKMRAAYLVRSYAHRSTESYALLLDAGTGDEIQRRDIRAYHSHQTLSDTSARGRVFRPNPCTAAGVPYGTLFSNNDDMHLPIFESYMDTIALRDLTYQNGQFLLEGPYVKVMEFAIPNVPPVSSSDGNFFFRRDQTGFEDVMAYYHIDAFQRYVQSLGYTDLYSTTPIQVDTHGAASNDQSSFSTNGRIQYGTNYAASNEHVDDAEDADVIIHEYGHALSHAAAPFTRGGTQRIGLDEGYCDYFTAAYSYDIRPDYGWALVFNWDGHNEFWPGRVADSDRKFASSGLGKYDYAEVWSSAMMRLRQDIGATECDRLQLEILYGSASNMTFFDAYQLLLQADTALFGGIYSPQITFRFCEIEVVTGMACTGVALEPDVIQASWVTTYDPHEGLLVKWKGDAENMRFRLINIVGQQIDSGDLQKGNLLHFTSLSPGVYIVNLYERDVLVESRKVVVW